MRESKRCEARFLRQKQACATTPARSLWSMRESMDRGASGVIQALQSEVDCKSF